MQAVRELLLAAAKAAGIRLWAHGDPWRDTFWTGLLLENGRDLWNPLVRDVDAFDLLLRLQMDLRHWDDPDRISAEHPNLPENWILVDCGEDRHAAARRAIVLAAVALSAQG